MPQRFLKPGLTSSKKWESCSWMSQSFFVRLITLVDDFGRYEADPILLKSHAFPLREDIRAAQVQELCKELQAKQLAHFYKSDGKCYVQLGLWTERPRAEKSKYPDPNTCEQMFSDNSCEQVKADESKCTVYSSSSSSSPSSPSNVIGSPPPVLADAGKEDPNIMPFAPVVVKKPYGEERKPIDQSRIIAAHNNYCDSMGLKPGMLRCGPAIERDWYEFLRVFTEDDFQRVFRYLRKRVKSKERNEGSLKLSNLLQLDKFAEDLALARTDLNAPLPGKKSTANGKPVEALPLPPAEDFKKGLDEMRKALK